MDVIRRQRNTTNHLSGATELSAPPQFKLDIKNAPIQEEEGDVNAALADMANTLRAVRSHDRFVSIKLTVHSKLRQPDAPEHYVVDEMSAIQFLCPTQRRLNSRA